MISKIAGGALFAGLLGVGGIAITKPYLLGMDHMPEFHTLDKDHDFKDTDYSTGKFAHKYTKYLTGVNKGKDNKTHQDWWEWAFRRLSKDENRSKNGKFKDVESGYGEDAAKNLSKVCKEAYGKSDGDFHTGSNENTDNKYTKDEVWKYCSVGGTKPTTIKEFNTGKTQDTDKETYINGKIGNGDDQTSKLISTKDKNNDWVWDLKDKEFSGMNVDQGYFKTEKGKENRKSLKDICQVAYGSSEKTDSTGDNLSKQDVIKYCSLEGK